MEKDNKDNFVEQKVKRVEKSDNKSDRLKEKLSIAFGFGVLVLPFSFAFLVIYALDMGAPYLYPHETPGVRNMQNILQIIFLFMLAGLVIMPIIGVFLGHKYEKATGKISVGKIMSIVSIIAVVLFSSVLILFHIVQQRAKEAEIERRSEIYRGRSLKDIPPELRYAPQVVK